VRTRDFFVPTLVVLCNCTPATPVLGVCCLVLFSPPLEEADTHNRHRKGDQEFPCNGLVSEPAEQHECCHNWHSHGSPNDHVDLLWLLAVTEQVDVVLLTGGEDFLGPTGGDQLDLQLGLATDEQRAWDLEPEVVVLTLDVD